MKVEIMKAPVAQTEMLVRKPVAEVFEAFIDPRVTTNFWFTKSSGRLEAGREVRWDWEMYGASTSVLVKDIEPDKRIVIEWDGYSGRTTVEWTFSEREDGTTYVVITESGWTGDGDELFKYVAESTQGFTWTLAGLKAFLEHGIKLNLVADKNPDALKAGWQRA
ncbi:SRPBCC family protein [Variovorax paradoxus]|uniref:SRPBCC family protein n=1 Tax=Variovorax paradoxus TaxID=34073 RepID=UPI00399B0382